MIKTKIEETYFEGTEAKSGILYSTVKQVNFLTSDNMILLYNELGVIEEVADPNVGTTYIYRALDNRALKYTENEIKTLIESTGKNFNSNLLVTEMNSFINDIIINDITNNPNKYFNISIDKWEAVI